MRTRDLCVQALINPICAAFHRMVESFSVPTQGEGAASLPTRGQCSIPAGVGGLDDVRGHVGDVVVAQAAAERRHRVLAVGHLSCEANAR